MLNQFLRYRQGPHLISRSWGFIVLFFTILVTLHFTLLILSPTDEAVLRSSIILEDASTTSSQPTPTDTGEPGTFKAFLNGIGTSKESSSKESSKGNNELAEQVEKTTHRIDPDDEYVAICMAVKGQHLDLPEVFIHHYHHLGIRRFYIMDDGSEPPLSSYEDYGIPRKHLTFHYWNRTTDRVPSMQHHVYQTCVNLYRDRHVWMAFFDADEMLEMTGEETLTEMLKRFEKNRSIGALAVSWKTHGSNGLLTRPESARKAFTDCIWDGDGHNKWFKSIVKTEFHDGLFTVHQAKLAANTQTVGEDGIPVPDNSNKREPPTRNRIALHHYAVKSREEYQQKVDRSNANDDPKDWSFWDSVQSMSGVPCEEMAQYEP